MRFLRKHLTYSWLVLLIEVIFGLAWFTGTNIQVGANTIKPTDLLGFIPLVVTFFLALYPNIRALLNKPIFGVGYDKIQFFDQVQDSRNPLDLVIEANRSELLKAVDQIWLSGLLDNLLNQHVSLSINLDLLEPDKLAKRMGGKSYRLTNNQEVLKAFEDFGRKLVLLGEPGSGKTVLMLQLARLLWNAAKRDEHGRIPIIFPLGSWAAKQLPFEKWLQSELRDRYSAPEKLAEALVGSEKLIYFFDGLDEVAADYRDDCLKALKVFVEYEESHVEYVLCSRKAEFVNLPTKLNVHNEIVLQPLKMNQIQDYLRLEPFAVLRGLLDTNPIIRNEFATIPFMLNTMAYVTRGKSADELSIWLGDKYSFESLQSAFLDNYITRRLNERSNRHFQKAKTTRHWLHWLAGQLINHDQTDFYLENLQSDWLENSIRIRLWQLYVILISGLIGVLVFGLIGGGVFILVDRAGFGVVSGILFGGAGGILYALLNIPKDHIIMSDQLSLVIDDSTLLGFLIGTLYGLLMGVFIGLAPGMLGGGLLGGLLGGLNSRPTLKYRVIPGQGIRRSLRNGLFITLRVGLLFGIVFGVSILLGYRLETVLTIGQHGNWERLLAIVLSSGLSIGLPFGIALGMIMGIGVFIQHYILRWMLAREGNLPFRRYDKFLDYANDLVILRKVGGGYRFTHDMLRQHLAGASAPPTPSTSE